LRILPFSVTVTRRVTVTQRTTSSTLSDSPSPPPPRQASSSSLCLYQRLFSWDISLQQLKADTTFKLLVHPLDILPPFRLSHAYFLITLLSLNFVYQRTFSRCVTPRPKSWYKSNQTAIVIAQGTHRPTNSTLRYHSAQVAFSTTPGTFDRLATHEIQ
jgi:hypothetical protein